MSTSELVRLRTPPVRLHPGQEWWTDNRHQLLARIRTEARRGTIQPLALKELAPGFYGALVVRLKPRPPRWRKPVLIAVSGVPVVVALVLLVIQVVQAVAAAGAGVLLIALAAWVAVRSLSGHRAVCVGLHCPGCKG